jgi:hypothetical protein
MTHNVSTLPALCLLVLCCASFSAHGQGLIEPTAGYTQNFDALQGSGTAGSLVPWTDNTTIPGWYAYKTRAITGSPVGPPANYFIDDGSSSTGGDGLRSYGALSSGQTHPPSDRALGELSSTDSLLVYSFAVRLVNSTGGPVSSLRIAYRGEQWRQNTGTKGLVCEYQIGAASIATGVWTPIPELDLQPLKTGPAAPLDGNAAGNFIVKTAAVSAAIAQGQELWMRWTKQGITSCGLAIDDLIVQPAPAVRPANLQFSVVTSTSMTVSFTAPSPASSGYVVLRKNGAAPSAAPAGGVAYAAGDTVGDAVVVSSGSSSAFSDRGLAPGSTYYYSVYPYNGSGNTIAYLTTSPLTGSRATPAAQASVSSDCIAVAGSEAASISSLINDAPPLSASSGITTWQLAIRDGGGVPDSDVKPTVVTGIMLRPGAMNTAAQWPDVLLAADLFDGAAHLAGGVITAAGIYFSPLTLSVPDDGSTTLTLRVSLKKTGLIDHQTLQFSLSPIDVETASDATSSQMKPAAAITSSRTKNIIDVAATKLRFFRQPSDAAVGTIITPSVLVEAADANNNRDTDFISTVSMTASGAVLALAPVAAVAEAGCAVFGTLTCTSAGSAVTLTAASNGWTVSSVPFRVPVHRTFYVDAEGGDDALSGLSPAAPWRSLDKVNSTVFVPGDSILFRSGRTWTGQLKPKGSGMAADPIVVSAYGGTAKPVINGAGVTGEAVVYLFNQPSWEITNLEITNDAANAGDRRGVLVAASNAGIVDHTYLKNLYIHNIKGIVGDDNAAKRTGGIGFEVTGDAVTPTRFNDIRIDSCTIAYCDNTGLYTDNTVVRSDYPNTAGWQNRKYTNLRVTNTVIHHIAKNAMIIRLAQGGVIEHNVCYETATGTTGNTMFTTSCDGTLFQYNEGSLNRADLQGGDYGDGSMYDADLQSINCVFQYSYSHDNAHGLFWTCTTQQDTGNVCRYNVSRNDKGIIFCINYPVSSVAVYNNTVYCGSPTLSPTFIAERNINSGTRTYTFSNNIIYNLSSAAQPYLFRTTGYTRVIDHNLFFGYHPANEPADANKLTGDPLFVDPLPAVTAGWNSAAGFALKINSPAIDNGAVLAGRPVNDYWGNPVPNAGGGIDRGAFEYQKTSSAPRSGMSIPGSFMLEQNYPNPFNPTTDIRYVIPTGALVTLNVFNILGQKIAALVNAYQDAGEHSVTFAADALSSGVYIYTLTVDGRTASKRLVLEK